MKYNVFEPKEEQRLAGTFVSMIETFVYLDLFANEIDANKRRADSKDTHIVSQSVSKEVREKLKAESKYPPTLGNLAVWGGGGYSEPAPAATNVDFADNTEDLPF